MSPLPGTSPFPPAPLLLRASTELRNTNFRGRIIEKFLFVVLCWPLGPGSSTAAAAFRGISAVKRKEEKRRRDTLTARRTTVVPLPHQSSVMMQSRMGRSGEHRAPSTLANVNSCVSLRSRLRFCLDQFDHRTENRRATL